MSEKELLELKEQLKQEIIAEMEKKKEVQTNWLRIKKEFAEDFKMFNKDNSEKNQYHLENAIGTLLKLLYKANNVSKIDKKYEDMKLVVEQLINVLKANMEVIE